MMLSKVKAYLPEIVVFGLITFTLIWCLAPDFTWINTDSDGVHYWFSASNLLPAHKTSAPLYLLIERAFLFIPYGTEFWRMALLSAISTIAACVFIYLIVKHHTNNRWLPLLGALVYGGSALVISQSTIVETYALNSLLVFAGYYLALKSHYRTACVVFGASLTVHFLSIIPIAIFIIYFKELRNWRNFLWLAVFFPLFLYMPLTNRPPYMWFPDPQTTAFFPMVWNNILAYIKDNFDTGSMLVGGIAIWDVPKRIIDAGLIYLASLGLIIVPVLLYVWSNRKKWYKNPLIWIVTLFTLLFVGNLAPQTYVYLMPAIGFASIMGCIWLNAHLQSKLWARFALACAILVTFTAGINISLLDIGNTLDPNLEARRYYDIELNKVPDNAILLCQWGWDWAACYPYMNETGRVIYPVCVGTLPSPTYQSDLIKQGIKLWQPEIVKPSNSDDIARSIVSMNDNVYMTVPTDAENYGTEVVLAKGNIDRLIYTGEAPETMSWSFKPSNPYDFITGRIEVSEWVNLIYTNYSAGFFGMIGLIGGVVSWVVSQVVNQPKEFRRKLKSLLRRPKHGIFRQVS